MGVDWEEGCVVLAVRTSKKERKGEGGRRHEHGTVGGESGAETARWRGERRRQKRRELYAVRMTTTARMRLDEGVMT